MPVVDSWGASAFFYGYDGFFELLCFYSVSKSYFGTGHSTAHFQFSKQWANVQMCAA